MQGPNDRGRALDAGFDVVVGKPVDLGVLCDAIAHLTDVRGLDGGGSSAPPSVNDARSSDVRGDVRSTVRAGFVGAQAVVERLDADAEDFGSSLLRVRVLDRREDQPLFDGIDPIADADLERAAVEVRRQ